MRLLGDKDHERVLDIVSKVEKKSNRKKPQANDKRVVVWPVRLVHFLCNVVFVIGEVISKLIVLI